MRRGQALAWTHSVERGSSARQEAALIGPVERQIEFGKTCRGEFDGLPAVQDRLDQLGAEKGEVDEAPDIATGDAVALGQFPQRSGAACSRSAAKTESRPAPRYPGRHRW
jgi:hypothetical protein